MRTVGEEKVLLQQRAEGAQASLEAAMTELQAARAEATAADITAASLRQQLEAARAAECCEMDAVRAQAQAAEEDAAATVQSLQQRLTAAEAELSTATLDLQAAWAETRAADDVIAAAVAAFKTSSTPGMCPFHSRFGVGFPPCTCTRSPLRCTTLHFVNPRCFLVWVISLCGGQLPEHRHLLKPLTACP